MNMPRKKRIWFPGAIYHVIDRGNRRTAVFLQKEDYDTYLKLLTITVSRFGLKLLGYCLMTNHIHLHIETSDVPIWEPLRHLNLNYTKYFNKKHNFVGHLFQDRYTSVCMQDEPQLLETSRYIHMNPVKAKMTERPEAYRWSSCAAYFGLRNQPLVHKDRILEMFGPDPVARYKAFVTVPGTETQL